MLSSFECEKVLYPQSQVSECLEVSCLIFRELIHNGCNLVIIQELSQNSTSNPEADCVSYITVYREVN